MFLLDMKPRKKSGIYISCAAVNFNRHKYRHASFIQHVIYLVYVQDIPMQSHLFMSISHFAGVRVFFCKLQTLRIKNVSN